MQLFTFIIAIYKSLLSNTTCELPPYEEFKEDF